MGVDRAIDITAKQRKIILALLERHLPNTTAWVYGSRAKWASRPQSDLDMVVFSTLEQNGRVSNLREAFEESNLPFRVDLFVWDAVPEQFRKQIKRDHVVLVEREERDVAGEWREFEFASLCDITRGASPRPIHEWIAEEGIPWVKISDASKSRSRFIARTRERIRSDGSTKSVSVFPGDLILSNSATPGIPMFMSIEACIHDGWLLLRDFRDIDKLFCYYLLLYEKTRIVRQSSGTVFNNLKTEILKRHRVSIPRLPEQRAIAHILGTLDDKIELNRRMNQTLEAMARALFKSWFVDFDPVRAKMEGRDTGLPKDIADLFPDWLVDSELGEMPEGWRVGQVEHGFEIIMGQSPPGHTYNDTGDGLPFFQGRSDFGFRYPKNRKFCTAPQRIAQRWDTIVSVRAPVGDINMVWERCCIGRGVAALRPRSGAVSFGYCAAQALQTHMREYEHTGTVFGAINRKQLARLPLRHPPPAVVRAFEHLVHPWDQTIRLRTAQVDTLTALRDTLLPKLVAGEIRVRDAEKLVGAIA